MDPFKLPPMASKWLGIQAHSHFDVSWLKVGARGYCEHPTQLSHYPNGTDLVYPEDKINTTTFPNGVFFELHTGGEWVSPTEGRTEMARWYDMRGDGLEVTEPADINDFREAARRHAAELSQREPPRPNNFYFVSKIIRLSNPWVLGLVVSPTVEDQATLEAAQRGMLQDVLGPCQNAALVVVELEVIENTGSALQPQPQPQQLPPLPRGFPYNVVGCAAAGTSNGISPELPEKVTVGLSTGFPLEICLGQISPWQIIRATHFSHTQGEDVVGDRVIVGRGPRW